MVRIAITFVFALMMSASAWAGNWNQSKDPSHTAQTGTVNIIVPDDVMTAFQNATPSVKAKHCSAKNDYPYRGGCCGGVFRYIDIKFYGTSKHIRCLLLGELSAPQF